MAALRYQAADRERPYKAPLGMILPAVSLILVGYAVYWTGWDTNSIVFLVALGGLALLAISRLYDRENNEPLLAGHTNWFWLFAAGIAAMSWLGNYGNGMGLIPPDVDLAMIAALSLTCFWLGLRWRLPDNTAQRFIEDGFSA
jgi:amino acid transporter